MRSVFTPGYKPIHQLYLVMECCVIPTEITEFLMNTKEPEVLKYFSERGLRPLTQLASDEDKITKFYGMMEAISPG